MEGGRDALHDADRRQGPDLLHRPRQLRLPGRQHHLPPQEDAQQAHRQHAPRRGESGVQESVVASPDLAVFGFIGSSWLVRLLKASRRLYAFIYHLSVCFALLQEDNFVALPKKRSRKL